MINNRPYSFNSATSAREVYVKQMNHVLNKRKHRCYWAGALYRSLFTGYYDTIYSERGECFVDVVTKGPGGTASLGRTRVFWYLSNDNTNPRLSVIRDWCKVNISTKIGNARRKSKDLGTMVVLGWRSPSFNQVEYASNRSVKGLVETMENVTEHFRHLFPDVVREISTRSFPSRKKIPRLKRCAASEMIVSKDLVNACHIDVNDKSYSVTTWLENIPGQTKGKYFILPFTSRDGKKSLVFPIVDGQSIAWDGRVLKHCSSNGDMGINNSVYGIFFSSK